MAARRIRGVLCIVVPGWPGCIAAVARHTAVGACHTGSVGDAVDTVKSGYRMVAGRTFFVSLLFFDFLSVG